MRHAAHLCKRWQKRGMQCPFGILEEEEKERERKPKEKEARSEQEIPEEEPHGLAGAIHAKTPAREFPWWLAIPLGEGVRRGLAQSGEFFDVLAAAEEIAAAEARKIPVSPTQSLFGALRPGREVMGVAAVVAGTAVAGLAARRFGGGRHFQANKFREALSTAQ